MKIKVLQEGKYQGQIGYHFTSLISALNIVKSDLMRATNWATSTGKWKDMEKSKSWSITRNKGGIKYRNFTKNPVRFDIDLWKLSNNQKIKGSYVDSSSYAPIQYKWNGEVDSKAIDFEYEMRPLGDTNDFHKCIKSISVCLETDNYIKSKILDILVKGTNFSEGNALSEIENKIKDSYPVLLEVISVMNDTKKFEELLEQDIESTLGANTNIDFPSYLNSDNFKFNFSKLIKECNNAIKMFEIGDTKLTVNLKVTQDILKDIIKNNNFSDYSNFVQFITTDSKWKDKPIFFVDTKGRDIVNQFKKGIPVDYKKSNLYQSLLRLEYRYTTMLNKIISVYIEKRRGILLLKEISNEDSWYRLYDEQTNRYVYVPAQDKDDIKEIKLILRKGKHERFSASGNNLLTSEDVIKSEVVKRLKYDNISSYKKKIIFYIAESFNLKKFLSFSLVPVKGINTEVCILKSKSASLK